MTGPRDPVEQALRSLYAARQAHPTAELRARIDAIPNEVDVGWSMRRRALGVLLGATALVGATVAVLVAVRDLARTKTPPPGVGSSAPYDPAHPNGGLAALTGVTFDGIGATIYWATAVILAGSLAWIAIAWFRGLGQAPKPVRPRSSTGRRIATNLAIWGVLFLAFSAVTSALATPLLPGSFSGSGLGVVAAREDGIDPSVFQRGIRDVSWGQIVGPGAFDGPRSVYAVAPGQPLTYVVSVRNSWPIGIRLLGRWRDSTAPTDATEPTGSTPTGLSLLREEDVVGDAGPEATKPFVPVDLAPGDEVTLVVAEVARSCADPTKVVPARRASEAFTIPRIQFVYEAFGIEGIATVGLSPEVTVPSNCP